MATSYQRRPDGKDPRSILDAVKNTPSQKLDPKLDALKEAADKIGEKGEKSAEKTELSHDLAAQIQASMGNAALQGLIKQGSETTTDSGDNTAQEQKQREEEAEEQEQEKEADSNEVERVLPIFGHAGGTSTGNSPWGVGHYFGGDDDADADPARRAGGRWRPMPSLPEPDEDAPLEGIGEEDGEDAELLDFAGAEEALGDAPWSPGLLSRGLRHAFRCALRPFSLELLAGLNRLDNAYGRGSAILKLLSAWADQPDARLLAVAVASHPVPTERLGFAGSIAHVLALSELILSGMDRGQWEPVLEVALDARTRGLAEEAAAALAPQGQLTAPAIFEHVQGELAEPADVDLADEAPGPALRALERVAAISVLPALDLWQQERMSAQGIGSADEELAAYDAMFGALFDEEAPPPGIRESDVTALFDGMNALLSAMGLLQVEVATAAMAALPWLDPQEASGICALFDTLLKRAARRLVRVGRDVEGLVGAEGEEALERLAALSQEAVALQGSTGLLRRGALCFLAGRLMPDAPADLQPAALPAGWEEAMALYQRGKTAEARDLLEQAIDEADDGDDEATLGRLHLLLGAWLLPAGFSGAAELHLDWAATLLGPAAPQLAAGAWLLLLSLHLDRDQPEEAREAAIQLDNIARDLGCPFTVAAAAIGAATAAQNPAVLEDGAWWLRDAGEGAALTLLRARWAEMSPGVAREPEQDGEQDGEQEDGEQDGEQEEAEGEQPWEPDGDGEQEWEPG